MDAWGNEWGRRLERPEIDAATEAEFQTAACGSQLDRIIAHITPPILESKMLFAVRIRPGDVLTQRMRVNTSTDKTYPSNMQTLRTVTQIISAHDHSGSWAIGDHIRFNWQEPGNDVVLDMTDPYGKKSINRLQLRFGAKELASRVGFIAAGDLSQLGATLEQF